VKKKPKSHVVALKQRTKERILGKAQGYSSTPSAGSDLPVPDVPPAGGLEVCPKCLITHAPTQPCLCTPWIWQDGQSRPATEEDLNRFPKCTPDAMTIPPARDMTLKVDLNAEADRVRKNLADTTAGLPPEALPEGMGFNYEHPKFYPDKMKAAIVASWSNQAAPVERHGTENDLARSIISKVPATKLDPNSPEAELARLEKSQLRNTKKKD
jgi:hypothetical protein